MEFIMGSVLIVSLMMIVFGAINLLGDFDNRRDYKESIF